jgi:hypothetical protein
VKGFSFAFSVFFFNYFFSVVRERIKMEETKTQLSLWTMMSSSRSSSSEKRDGSEGRKIIPF